MDYFKPGTDARTTEKIIQKKFGGSTPIQILVAGDMSDPRVLKAMKKMQGFLESQQDVNNAQSVADFIEEMSYVIGEGRIIPDSRAKVANLWFLLEGEEIMSQLVNVDKTEAVIQATLESGMQTDRVNQLVARIGDYIDIHNNAEYSFHLTGMPSIHNKLDESIKRSQIQSLVIAAVAIFVILFILLRSVIGALVGLIPIGFSLCGVFGFMGFSGIPLDIATVLVGSVSIGIGIDYSIHFLSRFKREFVMIKNVRAALSTTLQTTGKAILINVVTITAGFLVLLLANLIPLQRFGILVAITMLGSGFGALVILPAIIVITKPAYMVNVNSWMKKRKREQKTYREQ
jgi:hypothetical protein